MKRLRVVLEIRLYHFSLEHFTDFHLFQVLWLLEMALLNGAASLYKFFVIRNYEIYLKKPQQHAGSSTLHEGSVLSRAKLRLMKYVIVCYGSVSATIHLIL